MDLVSTNFSNDPGQTDPCHFRKCYPLNKVSTMSKEVLQSAYPKCWYTSTPAPIHTYTPTQSGPNSVLHQFRYYSSLFVSVFCWFFFKKKIWRTHVLFVGPLIPLFWTSGDVSPGFQSQGGSLTCVLLRLHTMNSSDSPLLRHLLTSCWSRSYVGISSYILGRCIF